MEMGKKKVVIPAAPPVCFGRYTFYDCKKQNLTCAFREICKKYEEWWTQKYNH